MTSTELLLARVRRISRREEYKTALQTTKAMEIRVNVGVEEQLILGHSFVAWKKSL